MWARLWHFTTAPRKVQWEVTQPQEGQNSLYLCKIILLPAFLYSAYFTTRDDTPGAFSCTQPSLPDSMFTKGGVDILSLVSQLEKNPSFIYTGKQKRPFSDKLSLQDQDVLLWLIKSGQVWPSTFISVPHSLHKSLEAEKDLGTWQCEERYCQNESMKA